MGTQSAANHVFGVTELLELILLELPIRTIFQAQRVCRHWKTVINNSSPLQSALWLTPYDLTSCKHQEVEEVALPASSPVFQALSALKYKPPYREKQRNRANWRKYRREAQNASTQPAELHVLAAKHLNPLLPHSRGQAATETLSSGFQIDGLRAGLQLGAIGFYELDDYLFGADGTGIWEQMQITDPPCVQLSVMKFRRRGPRLRAQRYETLYDKSGVRLGALMEVVTQWG